MWPEPVCGAIDEIAWIRLFVEFAIMADKLSETRPSVFTAFAVNPGFEM